MRISPSFPLLAVAVPKLFIVFLSCTVSLPSKHFLKFFSHMIHVLNLIIYLNSLYIVIVTILCVFFNRHNWFRTRTRSQEQVRCAWFLLFDLPFLVRVLYAFTTALSCMMQKLPVSAAIDMLAIAIRIDVYRT